MESSIPHISLYFHVGELFSLETWFILIAALPAFNIRVEVKLWTSIEQEPEWVGDCDRDGVWLRPSANTGWLKCEHCGVVACCRKGKYCKQPLHCPEYKRVHQDFVKTYLRSPLGSFKTSKSGIACREAILLQQVEPVASPGLSSRALS